MPRAVRIADAVAAVPLLKGRRPDTPEAEVEKAFATLAQSPETGIYAGSFEGESAWERHPNGDELVQIIDGAATVTVIVAGERRILEMSAGMVTLVPRACWHRFQVADRCTVMTMTPSPTEHFSGEDPMV